MTANAGVARVTLCLVSHTNAGKTTLARTLLGRDVGEVRDEPHVTTASEAYLLLATREGDELRLWDTPGFGDSVRLRARLRVAGNPIGWFLTEVWDRWTDRAFYLGQQAVRTARDEADVVLYLVNASEDPEHAGYLGPELDILAWVDRPVLVLLNQTGKAPDDRSEAADVRKWTAHLRGSAVVRKVLPLDAFTSCWVHEEKFFAAVGECVRDEHRPGYERLVAQWNGRNRERFDACMRAIAGELLDAASLAVEVEKRTLREKLLRWPWPKTGTPRDLAQQRLLEMVTSAREQATRRLLALHGLEGDAGRHPYWQRVDSAQFDSTAPVDSVKAGILGGIISGAASGLAADLGVGGMTLGAGALVGAIAGALSAGGAAAGTNVIRGVTKHVVRLTDEALQLLAIEEILKYAAIAHFGRGRGAWIDEEPPPFWKEVAAEAVQARADELKPVWASARSGEAREPLEGRLYDLTSETALAVFDRLHPEDEGGSPDARPSPDDALRRAPADRAAE